MATNLIWFRNDLRLRDNYAAYAACRDRSARVIALFVATPQQWLRHDMAPRQAEFIYQHLLSLGRALAGQGIEFYYHQATDFAETVTWLCSFCERRQVNALFYNYQYEINERKRDAQVERRLQAQGVVCQGFDDSVLAPPGSLLTTAGQMYKVFTPFRRSLIRRLQADLPSCLPPLPARGKAISAPVSFSFTMPRQAFDDGSFPVGEAAAGQQLVTFCRHRAGQYATTRDCPALDGTSRLSPYLAIGVLSPRQCLHALLAEQPAALENGDAFVWFNELIWRDFYRHLLVAFPHLCQHQPFISWTKNLCWQNNPQHFSAWQQGKTGYPIVDAAMRQLRATGWMHNRLRMVTASFLVKDLLTDWRLGERWFMSQLIDGDLAANNGGWQWVASTGTDAQPWFRVFNPLTQGKRVDRRGAFIRRWLPELADVPDRDIHLPHRWAAKNGRTIDYPTPIVDHFQARKRVLAAFEQARRSA